MFDSSLDGRTISRGKQLIPLLKEDYCITFISSDFNHLSKQKRNLDYVNKYKIENDISVVLISVPKYKKNIGLKRIYSNYIFSKKLKEHLINNKYDLIYCLVPSLLPALEVRKYCIEKKIKYILDVQDIWPEAFRLKFNHKLLDLTIYRFLDYLGDKIYESASGIIGVSDTNTNYALKKCSNKTKGITIYNGMDIDSFVSYYDANEIFKDEKEFWIIYIGALGNSYNIPLVIEAIASLNCEGYKSIKFMCVGSGPYREEWITYAKKMNCNSEFIDMDTISYKTLVNYLNKSDVGINPIFDTAPQSISNKVRDYSCAALPVISTQKNKEYIDLIEILNIGLNCDNSCDSLKEAILNLYQDKNLTFTMRCNVKNKFRQRFDVKFEYPKIKKMIDSLVEEDD